ncbi:RluA family pseudouridine synthase [uncultured Campylobacter sp.]|uniref:pseudouridine synthase family protein n=1 Tax=uncultured Campylobacter sp. TaxID=218934 RepID=UPI00261B8D7D|nr:RluA family pseudouridine synthase [uncultured Campylobacter sp.]
MPYIHKFIAHAQGQKAYEFLLQNGYKMREAQRLIDKGRLTCDGAVVGEKNALLSGEICLIDYETNPRGLKPIFECDKFAVFDKPSGVLSHPNGRHCEYSLNDEIWSLYGHEASVAHRLDCETSGLIVVGKDKNAVVNLKKLFENRQVYKSYVALVHGKISENLRIEANMDLANDYDDVKMRMRICEDGKSAVTEILPIEYFADIDATLVRAVPLTGRQHQIRLHLFHVEHKILGEPLYGLSRPQIEKILDKEMSESERILTTGAPRLLLHSDEICFKFDGVEYKIKSEFDAKDEFYKLVKHG